MTRIAILVVFTTVPSRVCLKFCKLLLVKKAHEPPWFEGEKCELARDMSREGLMGVNQQVALSSELCDTRAWTQGPHLHPER